MNYKFLCLVLIMTSFFQVNSKTTLKELEKRLTNLEQRVIKLEESSDAQLNRKASCPDTCNCGPNCACNPCLCGASNKDI